MKQSKRAMIEAMRKSLCIVSQACKIANISRESHYKWYKFDEEYKSAIDKLGEEVIEFAETSLMNQIKEKNTRATIFFLETRARERYGRNPETQINLTKNEAMINQVNVSSNINEALNKARERWISLKKDV